MVLSSTKALGELQKKIAVAARSRLNDAFSLHYTQQMDQFKQVKLEDMTRPHTRHNKARVYVDADPAQVVILSGREGQVLVDDKIQINPS